MDTETRHARVLVIVVHYKSSGALLEILNCLRWLNDNEDVGIMIVDNASGPEELRKIRPAVAGFCRTAGISDQPWIFRGGEICIRSLPGARERLAGLGDRLQS